MLSQGICPSKRQRKLTDLFYMSPLQGFESSCLSSTVKFHKRRNYTFSYIQ